MLSKTEVMAVLGIWEQMGHRENQHNSYRPAISENNVAQTAREPQFLVSRHVSGVRFFSP